MSPTGSQNIEPNTRPLAAQFDAIVFDKDGTLLDFSATWDPAIADAIICAAPDDEARQDAIASVLGFDLTRRTCLLGAPVVHKSNTELVEMLSPVTDGQKLLDDCAAFVLRGVEPVPRANKVLRTLQEMQIPAAVATNDDEASAKAQCDALGWLRADPPLLRPIIGCDSGHGHKPNAGPLLSAAKQLGVAPSRCAMIGDALGDLKAARAAGFGAAILVGPAEVVGEHAPHADVWIKDLGGLLEPHAWTLRER